MRQNSNSKNYVYRLENACKPQSPLFAATSFAYFWFFFAYKLIDCGKFVGLICESVKS